MNTSSDNQKVQRSKLFKSINEKYGSWKCTGDDLIQSRAQQEDARCKEYFIASDQSDELEAILMEAVITN